VTEQIVPSPSVPSHPSARPAPPPRRRRGVRPMVAAALLGLGALLPTAPVASVPAGAAVVPGLTVVIMPGLGGKATDYSALQTVLEKQYTVKVYELPNRGYVNPNSLFSAVLDIDQDLTPHFANWVAQQIPTGNIAIVAHSAGGLVARDYIKRTGGARVTKLVMAGVANYGTVVFSSGNDYEVGSAFLNGLNTGDVSVGTVGYWSFTTVWDTIVAPYENQLLPRTSGTRTIQVSIPYVPHEVAGVLPDPQVTNVVIQDQCPSSTVGHIGMTKNATVQSGIVQALAGERHVVLPC